MQQIPSTDQIFKEEGIVCHSYSPDGQFCAVSLKKSNVIEIYRISQQTYKNINSWQYECTLKEHKQTISDLSFSCENKLLSVSHDKSVFVWKRQQQAQWAKEAVDCQSSFALLKCCWSKNGKKFAIGSGDHKVYIGYYDTQNKWWSTIPVSGQKSSISSIQFHPSSKAIAIGSMDNQLYLISCNLKENYNKLLKDTQSKNQNIEVFSKLYKDQQNNEDSTYDNKFVKFDNWLTDLCVVSSDQAQGWIDSVCFSEKGTELVFSVHNSSMYCIQINEQTGECNFNKNALLLKELPVCQIVFKNEIEIVCGTYDGQIILIQVNADGNLSYIKNVVAGGEQKGLDVAKGKVGDVANMFEKKNFGQNTNQQDKNKGKSNQLGHTNAVICLKKYTGDAQFVVSSNDINGNLFFWNI